MDQQRKGSTFGVTTRLQKPLKLAMVCLTAVVLVGCASAPKDLRAPIEQDPWESLNRSVYGFNKNVDQVVLRPVALVYDEITPEPAKAGVSNFFANLSSPWTISQLLLQGRFRDGSEQFGRFLINTVYGVGGLFDVAEQNGLPDHETDLGVTLAQWGWEDSRFVMLPLFGPSTIRDGVAQITEMTVDPVDQELRQRTGLGITVLEVVSMRQGLLGFDATLEGAYDEYALVRDGWLQRRQFQLKGDQAELPDYDAFLEESDDPSNP